MLSPDSANRGLAHSFSSSHQSSAPMRRIWRLPMQGRLNNPPDLSIGNLWKATRTRSILFKSWQTKSQKPLPPKLHCRARNSKGLCYFLAWHSIGGHLNYLGALNNTGREGSALRPGGQSVCFGGREYYRGCSSGHEQHHTLFWIYVKLFMTHYTRTRV